MAQEVTTMVIKVDLACEKCRKKIKKVLCDIPQIQNQVYDQKANTMTITVVCCSPNKIKKKICCKGGKTVKCIEILKPPPAEKQKDAPKPTEAEPDKAPVEVVDQKKKSKDDSKAPPPPPTPPTPPGGVCCRECYEGVGRGPCWAGYGRPAGPCCYGGYGRPVYDSWGCGYNWGYCHPSRCTYYIYCEKNPSACTIM